MVPVMEIAMDGMPQTSSCQRPPRDAAADTQFQRLIFDARPGTELQRVILRGIAEDAAEQQALAHAEAVLSGAASKAAGLLATAGGAEAAEVERALVMASPAVTRLAQRRAASRSNMLRGIRTFYDVRREDRFDEGLRAFDEDDCRAWLLRRFSAPDWVCPRCGHNRGDHLLSRELWECRECRYQMGWRVGTVMERSPVALGNWFSLICVLVKDPSFPPAEFAKALLMRPQTVQQMRQRIVGALDDPPQRHRLIGLDEVFAAHLSGPFSLRTSGDGQPARSTKKIQISQVQAIESPEPTVLPQPSKDL